ncbi:Uncharacterised protein [uncultured Clostridium sp.]|uniref:hypothetical protein n=1 Tax=uncultured Clostridium sp. TaxID=59620 RepID=UPI00082045CC|nr:hypothetical protein [uncultured Clostridium sp.]SCJ98904.1 Uncharacterised protein [uncultured Clostridium sp.]
MLKMTADEFILRLLPEAFIFIFAAYAFSKTRINKSKYLLSSFLLGLSVFIIRMLPINYGVHTILNIIMLAVISYSINKIDLTESIKVSIITAICLFLLEGLNMLLLSTIFGDKLDNILSNTILKTVSGLPSLIGFGLIVIGYYGYLKKRKKLRNV